MGVDIDEPRYASHWSQVNHICIRRNRGLSLGNVPNAFAFYDDNSVIQNLSVAGDELSEADGQLLCDGVLRPCCEDCEDDETPESH